MIGFGPKSRSISPSKAHTKVIVTHWFIICKINHASRVADLNINGISSGFISSLGQDFVTSLYEAVAEDDNSFGFVALEDKQVIGFAAFSKNLSKLYKYVALKKGFKFAFILLRKLISLQTIKKIWSNIFYPKKMKRMNLPDAELLSIVIAPEGRGKGIAKNLIKKGFEECRLQDIKKLRVLVSADNQAANNLYVDSGFKLHFRVDSHGIKSNIYVADV